MRARWLYSYRDHRWDVGCPKPKLIEIQNSQIIQSPRSTVPHQYQGQSTASGLEPWELDWDIWILNMHLDLMSDAWCLMAISSDSDDDIDSRQSTGGQWDRRTGRACVSTVVCVWLGAYGVYVSMSIGCWVRPGTFPDFPLLVHVTTARPRDFAQNLSRIRVFFFSNKIPM